MARRPRILVGKPGLDGHDRGAKVIASALRDAGMEVIYTGLRVSPEAIVATAAQESVDVIGLSILSGAHETICARIAALLRERELDIPVVVGGVIPHADVPRLKELGVADVFGQEATLPQIVSRVRDLAAAASEGEEIRDPGARGSRATRSGEPERAKADNKGGAK
ncbi:MAG TPA: cobalamin B12-binding domain-containing protein [Haliangiales bacterium]|nr:cobalamin B12-binding domain-containing protein [Haliangiales bacterium]